MPNGRTDYYTIPKRRLATLLESFAPDEVIGVIGSYTKDAAGKQAPVSIPVATSRLLMMLAACELDEVFVDEQDGDEQDGTFYIVQMGPRLPSWVILTHSSPLVPLLREDRRRHPHDEH